MYIYIYVYVYIYIYIYLYMYVWTMDDDISNDFPIQFYGPPPTWSFKPPHFWSLSSLLYMDVSQNGIE